MMGAASATGVSNLLRNIEKLRRHREEDETRRSAMRQDGRGGKQKPVSLATPRDFG
jgi:hypothetical protein